MPLQLCIECAGILRQRSVILHFKAFTSFLLVSVLYSIRSITAIHLAAYLEKKQRMRLLPRICIPQDAGVAHAD